MTNHTEIEKVVATLEVGDRLLNLFDLERVVTDIEPTDLERVSKWTGEPVQVIIIHLSDGDFHYWNADRKIRVVA